MLFRDARRKIQQAAMHDFLVRRIMDTRQYIEHESGQRISDEDFYAALAVAMMESREHVIKTHLDHMAFCTSQRPIIQQVMDHLERPATDPFFTQREMRLINSVFPGTFLPLSTEPAMSGFVPTPGSLQNVQDSLDRIHARHGRTKRPPSKLHPLVQQDERDREAVEGESNG